MTSKREWVAIILFILLSTASNATPPCPEDIIGAITLNNSRATLANVYNIGWVYGSDSSTMEKILRYYRSGKNLSQTRYRGYGIGEIDTRDYYVHKYYGEGIAKPGDILITRCWDEWIYDSEGNIKYLTDGIIVGGEPVMYEDFMPWVYALLVAIIFALLAKCMRPSIKEFLLPNTVKLSVFALLLIISLPILLFSLSIWGFGFNPTVYSLLVVLLTPFTFIFYLVGKVIPPVIFFLVITLNLAYNYLLACLISRKMKTSDKDFIKPKSRKIGVLMIIATVLVLWFRSFFFVVVSLVFLYLLYSLLSIRIKSLDKPAKRDSVVIVGLAIVVSVITLSLGNFYSYNTMRYDDEPWWNAFTLLLIITNFLFLPLFILLQVVFRFDAFMQTFTPFVLLVNALLLSILFSVLRKLFKRKRR